MAIPSANFSILFASIFGWKSSLFGSGKISESDSSELALLWFGGATDQKKKERNKRHSETGTRTVNKRRQCSADVETKCKTNTLKRKYSKCAFLSTRSNRF